jgi:IS5 family transposase
LPVDFSQISRWRKRIGKEGVERILKLTIEAGLRTRTITPKQMEVVVVDTTVQPKAVEHPTDARLFRKVLHHLWRVAEETGTKLRQSHRDLAKSAFLMHGRYAKAKQFRRAAKERKKLKVYAGRVLRDLERKLSGEDYERHKGTMILAELALTQEKKTKGKVYSMHAPEVECIAKGKAHKPYDHPTEAERMEDRTESAKPIAARRVRTGGPNQIGVKTSLATTAWGGFAVGAMALPGNPFDGHTLEEQLVQVERLTGMMPKRCHVDRGYKGHGVDSEICRVIIAGSKKGISKALKKEMKRRSGIEAEIGHQTIRQQQSEWRIGPNPQSGLRPRRGEGGARVRADGKLGRNWLKGMLGDAQNAILCAAGHNLRKILAHLRHLFVLVWAWLVAALRPMPRTLASMGGAA